MWIDFFSAANQNNIENCGLPARIIGSDNAFYPNNFIENEHRVSISHQTIFSSNIIVSYSTNNTFDSGYPSGGNYWSDYGSADADGDGVGDTPYTVCEGHMYRYPLMKPVSLEILPPVLDTAPPSISIISPENKTYQKGDIKLNFKVSKQASLISYALDGEPPVKISGNTTLIGLSNGTHTLILYATDAMGNTGTSETVHFTIAETQTEPESFPATLAIVTSTVAVTIVAVGLIVYFKKRRR